MRKTILAQLFNLLYPRLWLQHDQNIANSDGATVRADINNALGALFSNSSGLTAPSTTVAYQLWADTTTGLLKVRNAANTNWVTVGTLASTNLGLATLADPSFTGTATFAGDASFTSASASLTLGSGGTGSTIPILHVKGGSGTGGGGYIKFSRNSSDAVFLGTDSAINGGTSSDATLYATGAFRVYSNGIETIRVGAGGLGVFCTPSYALHVEKAQAGSDLRSLLYNTSNTASSEALLQVIAGGSSAGDARINFEVGGVTDWNVGVDNSDSDKFKVSQSGSLGTNDYLTIDTSGNVGGTAVTGTWVATQAQMEAASATSVIVTPGRVQYHPGVAKAFCAFDVAGSIGASYNVTSVTDSGTGDWTVNLTTAFSSANFAATAGANTQTAGTANRATGILSQTASTIRMQCEDSSGSAADPSSGYISVSAFGDQ